MPGHITFKFITVTLLWQALFRNRAHVIVGIITSILTILIWTNTVEGLIVTCETWRVNIQPGGKPGADVTCRCNCSAAFQMISMDRMPFIHNSKLLSRAC